MNDALNRRMAALMADTAVTPIPRDLAFGHPMVTRIGPQGQAQAEYGVDHDAHGNVVLSLGDAPTFKVPRDTGIKLALLILKHCGVSTEAVADGK